MPPLAEMEISAETFLCENPCVSPPSCRLIHVIILSLVCVHV